MAGETGVTTNEGNVEVLGWLLANTLEVNTSASRPGSFVGSQREQGTKDLSFARYWDNGVQTRGERIQEAK